MVVGRGRCVVLADVEHGLHPRARSGAARATKIPWELLA